MSLFRPDELVSIKEFLHGKFGRAMAQPHELLAWRMAETKQFLDSAQFAIRNYFKTATKGGHLTTVKPFTGQAILSVCIESQRRRGLPQRVVEDKPRQVGWTTWDLGEAFHCSLHENRRALVLVNDDTVVASLATRLGTMLNGLPAHMQPMRRIQNLNHIVFDNPNPKERLYDPGLNSEIQITVPSSMRGITPTFVVISEFAFMDDARKADVNQGLIAAMPLSADSCVIIDTTPNGYDDYYHPMMMEAVENNPKWVRRIETSVNLTPEDVLAGKIGEPDHPKRGFVPAFSTWFQHEEYTTRDDHPLAELPRLTKAEKGDTLDDLGKQRKYGGNEELTLYESGVSIQRLYWRRYKIDNYQLPTQELRLLTFSQEYPSTIVGSFINYGNSPFDRECLDVVARQGREPIARGILREQNGKLGIDTTYHSDWQDVRVYAPPEQGEKYSMGVDTGLRFESLDSDASAAQIVRWRDNKVVCTYEARVNEHELRLQLFSLYRWYFHAYTGIELSGIGFQLIRTLIAMGLHNYYSWKRLDSETPEPTKYPGWETNGKTRPLMDSTMVELICQRNPDTNRPEPDIIVPDIPTLRQLQTVTRQPSGAIKSTNGHDDLVDAMAIALCIARDGWGGFHRFKRDRDDEEEDQRPNNFAMFAGRWRSGYGTSRRNDPDIANL